MSFMKYIDLRIRELENLKNPTEKEKSDLLSLKRQLDYDPDEQSRLLGVIRKWKANRRNETKG